MHLISYLIAINAWIVDEQRGPMPYKRAYPIYPMKLSGCPAAYHAASCI